MEKENEIKIDAYDEKKENNLKISENSKIEQKNEEKTKEEKPKEIPKKLDIDAMKQRMEEDEEEGQEKMYTLVKLAPMFQSE